MLEGTENFTDFFRGCLPCYLTLVFSIILIYSANPALASNEYKVYRMSQFDVNGIPYGCRASALSLEAKSLFTWTTQRHCVIARLQDLSIEQFNEIRQKAGGLVLLLPKNISNVSAEKKNYISLLEQTMLAQQINIPVYFARFNKELERVISEVSEYSINANAPIKSNNNQVSVLTDMFSTISANGYHVIISGATHTLAKNNEIPILQGELLSKSAKHSDGSPVGKNKIPVIVIVAHLNPFGIFKEYNLNSDAVVLMILIEQFSKLFNTFETNPKYKLLFLLTESGSLLNFQGSKKWLDENVNLQNVDFVLCLETLISSLNSKSGTLYVHVSKPPKEDSPISNFYKALKNVSTKYGNATVENVHKKINLAEQQLAWEHERFSMKRLPAFTVSSLKSPKDTLRTTVFKDSEEKLITLVQEQTKLIAEALGYLIFDIEEDGEIFADDLEISKSLVKSYLNVQSAMLNNDLKNGYEKYLKNVKMTFDKPDARDPDFFIYNEQEANLNVYRVKPAVFDIFLTALIGIYLAAVYFAIQNFYIFYIALCKITRLQVAQQNDLRGKQHKLN